MKTALHVVTSCTAKPCGACCSEMGLLPMSAYVGAFAWNDPSDLPPELLAELKEAKAAIRDDFPDDAPCIWLDGRTKLCKHYQYRPSVCRDNDDENDGLTPGDEGCLEWRRTKGIE